MGRKFLLKIDNMSVKYLFEQLDMNAWKYRWLDLLSEYRFELKNIKGKENNIIDALSRGTHMIYELIQSKIDAYLHENIRMANKVDPFSV